MSTGGGGAPVGRGPPQLLGWCFALAFETSMSKFLAVESERDEDVSGNGYSDACSSGGRDPG